MYTRGWARGSKLINEQVWQLGKHANPVPFTDNKKQAYKKGEQTAVRCMIGECRDSSHVLVAATATKYAEHWRGNQDPNASDMETS